ncbi:hypothetical protein AB0F91_44050 [Amycolatopsis sp. NPDC023774]|uniref:hypothetical protein n=1 Tax=Amycolatopsis sp. NPDC023774 TaxID=3155015 RepID=UPI0033EB9D13
MSGTAATQVGVAVASAENRHDEHEGGNSHMPVLSGYRRMLLGYQAVVADRKACEGDSAFGTCRFEIAGLQKILDAAWRPGTRLADPENAPSDAEGARALIHFDDASRDLMPSRRS